MKLIAGIGNPGDSYSYNRHNVGQMFINAFESELEKKFNKSLRTMSPRSQLKFLQSEIAEYSRFGITAKTKIFMNESGLAVTKLVDRFKTKMDDLYVVHDDLDIALGEYKIQKGKGPRGHNGINSIEEHLGKDDFWRVRIGVENRDRDSKIPGEVYVLQNFTQDEERKLSSVFEKIIADLLK